MNDLGCSSWIGIFDIFYTDMYIILHVALDISEKSYGLLEIDLITSVFTS